MPLRGVNRGYMMDEKAVITIDQVSLGYGEKSVITDLSAGIPGGKITAVIGANGCGKSTLLKGIARVLQPSRGRFILDGKDIRRIPPKELAKRMSFLPQSPKAPAALTAGELVSFGRFPHQRGFGALSRTDYEIIHEALSVAGIEDLRGVPLAALSGGQRQRAWIAMTLCQQADIMLLDEPATYLDMAHQLDVLSLLARLNRRNGRTIVMVLHEINSAARFVDNMIAMKDGEIIVRGPPEEVVTRENLKRVYDIDAQIVHDGKTGRPVCLSYETAESVRL
jgi:iron complex transport system ATP-binding protein